MELTGGIHRWNLPMEFTDGIYRWNLPMEFTDGIHMFTEAHKSLSSRVFPVKPREIVIGRGLGAIHKGRPQKLALF